MDTSRWFMTSLGSHIEKTKLKGKLKVNTILIDDKDLAYKVIVVFPTCVILEELKNDQSCCCEIMTYEAMEKEGWFIANN